MGSARDAFGKTGEAIAERWLASAGMRTVARRVRNRCGEIDLVCLDGAEVVFVEVKTRSGRGYGSPAEAVTWTKRRKLRNAAWTYLQDVGWDRRTFRIDVVGVIVGAGEPLVEHIRHAVGEG